MRWPAHVVAALTQAVPPPPAYTPPPPAPPPTRPRRPPVTEADVAHLFVHLRKLDARRDGPV